MIFHSFTKIGNQNCKVIVDCESCINIVFSELFGADGLKSVPLTHPFKVHGSNSVIGVKQPCLVSIDFHLYFWRTLWHMLGAKSKFSTALQPQADGQIEVVDRSLGKNLHDIVYGFRSRHPINFFPVVDHYKVCIIIKISESASSFASLHVHKLHMETNDKIAQNNANYKLRINSRK